MRFVPAIPGIGALPELRTYESRDCVETTTEEMTTLVAAAVH